MEKTNRVDFAVGFCCLDVVSSRGKENDKEKAEKLGGRLLLQYF